jgi:hypothetical protein
MKEGDDDGGAATRGLDRPSQKCDGTQHCEAPSCWRKSVTKVYEAWLCRPCRKRALEVSS